MKFGRLLISEWLSENDRTSVPAPAWLTANTKLNSTTARTHAPHEKFNDRRVCGKTTLAVYPLSKKSQYDLGLDTRNSLRRRS